MEKNWSPIVVNRTLYLVHNLDPLRVIQCDLRMNGSTGCDFIQDEAPEETFNFIRRRHLLRGGTPFVLYSWPYYIGLAHSVVIVEKNETEGFRYNRVRRYEANIVVVRVQPKFRVVYVSCPLKFNPEIYKNINMVYYEGQVMVENEFIYPVSVVRESSDCIAVGGHIKDRVSVLFRVTGIRAIMAHIASLGTVTKQNFTVLSVQEYVRNHFPLQ
jgi:hypothetical protein